MDNETMIARDGTEWTVIHDGDVIEITVYDPPTAIEGAVTIEARLDPDEAGRLIASLAAPGAVILTPIHARAVAALIRAVVSWRHARVGSRAEEVAMAAMVDVLDDSALAEIRQMVKGRDDDAR